MYEQPVEEPPRRRARLQPTATTFSPRRLRSAAQNQAQDEEQAQADHQAQEEEQEESHE